jgi:hypothetical protein
MDALNEGDCLSGCNIENFKTKILLMDEIELPTRE